MKRTRDRIQQTERKASRAMRPKLQLIRGGALDAGRAQGATARSVRRLLIERARTRLARGYYERAAVKRKLVDTLWQELFAEA